jgi:four helix bundle protein
MGLAKKFEDLEVWQEARQLARVTYELFAMCKDYGFRDQILRSVVSVMNNIAEGFERRSRADFARFLDMAKGSCGEARSMLFLACDIGHAKREKGNELIERFDVLSRRIGALTRKLRA